MKSIQQFFNYGIAMMNTEQWFNNFYKLEILTRKLILSVKTFNYQSLVKIY